MVKMPVCQVGRSVKTVRRKAIIHSLVHGVKVRNYFGFKITNYTNLSELTLMLSFKCANQFV
jgi:hypothetical protein